jgi:glycine cleavage system H protein
MSLVPAKLKYTSSHEWVKQEDNGHLTIGITDHAQSQLGDVVYVELPQVGDELEASQELGVVESVKAAADIYSPITGKVVAINESLQESPEYVNEQPYAEGWLVQVEPTNKQEWDTLLNADEYQQQMADQ